MDVLDVLAICAGNAIRRPPRPSRRRTLASVPPRRAIAPPSPVTLAPPSGGAVWPAIAAVHLALFADAHCRRSAARFGDVSLAGTLRVPLPVPSSFPVGLRRRVGAWPPAVPCLPSVCAGQGSALGELAVRFCCSLAVYWTEAAAPQVASRFRSADSSFPRCAGCDAVPGAERLQRHRHRSARQSQPCRRPPPAGESTPGGGDMHAAPAPPRQRPAARRTLTDANPHGVIPRNGRRQALKARRRRHRSCANPVGRKIPRP